MTIFIKGFLNVSGNSHKTLILLTHFDIIENGLLILLKPLFCSNKNTVFWIWALLLFSTKWYAHMGQLQKVCENK